MHSEPISPADVDRSPGVHAAIRAVNQQLQQPWSAAELASGRAIDLDYLSAADRAELAALYADWTVTPLGPVLTFGRP